MANKKIQAEPYLSGLGLPELARQLTTLWRSLSDWINNAALNDLANVDAGSPTTGDVLRWDGSNWVPDTLALDDLSDVTITSPTSGQRLVYNGSAWVPLGPYQVNAFGTGSVYTMTTTAAAISMGTTSPAITLAQAGTYLIRGYVRVFSNAATISGQSFTLKFRRTNNTAADLSDGSIVYAPMAATTASYTIGVVPMPEIIYTTANTNDALTIFANISGALGAGSIQVSAAEIIAERI